MSEHVGHAFALQQRTRRHHSRRRSIEALESRMMLAGDLIASFRADDLNDAIEDNATIVSWEDSINQISAVASGQPKLELRSDWLGRIDDGHGKKSRGFNSPAFRSWIRPRATIGYLLEMKLWHSAMPPPPGANVPSLPSTDVK